MDVLFVIAVRREVSNLTMTLHEDSNLISTPNKVTKFVVSMETTIRHRVYLEVEFNSKSLRMFKLEEEREGLLGDDEPSEHEGVSMVASYGLGCTLVIDIKHMYQTEGTFKPKVKLYSNISILQTELSDSLVIQKALNKPQLYGPQAIAVDRIVNLTVLFQEHSLFNITYYWSIEDGGHKEEHNITTRTPNLSHRFTKSGTYTVYLKAENLINYVETRSHLYVEVPLAELGVEINQDIFVKTGDFISFDATLEKGSGADFEWNFSDPGGVTYFGFKNLSSFANHSYNSPGEYNVSVHAFNRISHLEYFYPELIVVEDAVKGLDVTVVSPMLLGNKTSIIAMVTGGTGVKFAVDFGKGREVLQSVGIYEAEIRKKMLTVGKHLVTVYAYNNVSVESETILLEVQDRIRNISVTTSFTPVKKEPIVFAARLEGRLSARDDLIYTWKVDREVVAWTRAPVMDRNFAYAGSYNISVTAFNDVAEAGTWQLFAVQDYSSKERFETPAVAQYGIPTTFYLKNLALGPLDILIQYDNKHKSMEHTTGVSVSFNLTFQSPGVYEVLVNARPKTQITANVIISSAITIQQKIEGLKLNGPTAVAFNRSSVEETWSTELRQGSHLVYAWRVSGGKDDLKPIVTTRNQTSWRFQEIGIYNISVSVSNSLNHQMAWLLVSVEYPITAVQVQILPTVLGRASNFEFLVYGGPFIKFYINFGDGVEVNLSSESEEVTKEIQQNDPNSPEPVNKYIISHNYTAIGQFEVIINVTNQVSWRGLAKDAFVEEPITGMEIFTDSLQIVKLGTSVAVTATVATGNDLSFDWDFSVDERISVTSHNNTSTATHMFQRAQTYSVQVYVSNPLYSEPLLLTLPFQFIVVQDIEGLAMTVPGGKMAANLTKDHQDNYSTQTVTFIASVTMGSSVSFTFDYGDRSTETISGLYNYEEHNIMSVGRHIYRNLGAYSVSVTASNLLTNQTVALSELFYVQIPPSRLQLSLNGEQIQNGNYIQFGNVSTFTATIKEGNDVHYDWSMGDQRDYIDQGPTVSHRYLSANKFRVSVKAYNKVSSISLRVWITVQEAIQGVDLVVSKTLYELGEGVTLTARPYPYKPAIVDYYQWDYGDDTSRHASQSILNVQTKNYAQPGSYVVSVTALNNISQRRSSPVQIFIVDRLSSVKLEQQSGEPVVGHRLEFVAKHYQGSNATYYWSFGNHDGYIITRNKYVAYTYYSTGQFVVNVTVSNPLGNLTSSLYMFILERICKPPTITLLNKGVRVERSQDIKLEAEVFINCSITSNAVYNWTLQNSTTGELILPQGIKPEAFRDSILYIPRRTLPYGNYTVVLSVSMAGTIVFSREESYFLLVASPLVAVISGGIQRHVSRTETITMDGSQSYDPDFPGRQNFSYEWECYQLMQAEKPCFTSNLTLHNSTVSIPGNLFIKDVTNFVFNLTVKFDTRGTRTNQVLQMAEETLLDIQVLCVECTNEMVNADQRLVLHAEHPGLHQDDLIYQWEFFDVADGKMNYAGAHDHGSCVEADGSSYHSYLYPNDTSIENDVTGIKKDTDEHTDLETQTTTSTTVPSTTKTTTTTARNPFLPIEESGTNEGILPGLSEGSSDTDGPGNPNPGAFPGFPGFPGLEGGYPPFGGLPLGEAAPGEAGSTAGRDSGGLSGTLDTPAPALPPGLPPGFPPILPEEGTSDGGRGTGSVGSGNGNSNNLGEKDKGTQGGSKNELTDGLTQSRLDPHVVNMLRYPILISQEHTTTGFHQRAVVIKQGFLKQGQTYMAMVKVTKIGSNTTGMALSYFRINESPGLGECSIKPDEGGIEMETEFRIYCKEWKDDDQPISYEVSYSLESGGVQDVVYRGLNPTITFQLPAGHDYNNHTVEVHISILDALSARTSVCSLLITVKPKTLATANKTEEQVLYDIVNDQGGLLQTLVDKGDNRNVRLQTQLVAHRLNRLNKTNEAEQQILRRQIRSAMLAALSDLPMRDQYEVLQTTSAVATSTAVTDELEGESLQYASQILDRAVSQVEVLANLIKQQLDNSIISLALEGTANILAAVATPLVAQNLEETVTESRYAARLENVEPPESPTEKVVSLSRNAIHALLKTELQFKVMGEEPYKKDTPFLYTEAGRYRTSENPKLESQAVRFHLPNNMKELLDKNSVVRSSGAQITSPQDCFESHLVNFKRNPYLYGPDKDIKVQTQVASLTLFTCEGEELNVNNLPDTDEIYMDINHEINSQENAQLEWIGLNKHEMNTHQFNVTGDNAKQSLHIMIELKPVLQGRLFPIAVLLSAGSPPTPEQFFYREEFAAGNNHLQVYVEPYTLQVGTEYYLGLTDVYFNKGRPREGEVREREYRLWMWWGECIYWDETDDYWASQGCHMMQSSSYNQAHCSCNHLTSFSARFSLTPNKIQITNVEEFFDLHENPVTFALIASVLTVYLVLIVICIKLDKHDSMKGSIVHLIDNNPIDQQTYIVTLETGFRYGAGTTAKVSLVLHGEDGMSETRELVSESGQPLFERNSRDAFILTFPDSLGPIWKIQLWHNNVGVNPSWYLSRVTVKDLTTGITYYFNSEKWFAVEEEDGKVEREVMVTESGLGMYKVLWAKGVQYFVDLHLWLSAFTRPPYSRFSRAQRLTCCLTLLMSYMAVNAVWYQYKEKEYRGEFGLIDVSWRSVVVGMLTSLIVLPVNFIIVFIFRRSKIKKIRIEDPPEKKYMTKHDSVSSLDSTTRLLQPTMTPSLFDQSIINWQSLQEWAQRQWAKRYHNSVNSSMQSIKPNNPHIQQAANQAQPLQVARQPSQEQEVRQEEMVTHQESKVEPQETDLEGRENDTEKRLEVSEVSAENVEIDEKKPETNARRQETKSEANQNQEREKEKKGSTKRKLVNEKEKILEQQQKQLIQLQQLLDPEEQLLQLTEQVTQELQQQRQQKLRPKKDEQLRQGLPQKSKQESQERHEHQQIEKGDSRPSSSEEGTGNSQSERSEPQQIMHPPAAPNAAMLTAAMDTTGSSEDHGSSVASSEHSRSHGSVSSNSVSGSGHSMDYGRHNPAVAKEQQAKLKKRILETIKNGKSSRVFLPAWCSYVAWVLCGLIITGSAIVTMLYGFMFGRTQSIMWLQSLFFSFVQCAFITHPVLIFLLSLYTSIRYHDNLSIFDHHDDGILDEKMESHSSSPEASHILQEREYDLTEGIAARQRSRYLRFARPPQEKHLIEARKRTIGEKKTTSVCTESVGLSILFFLLLVVAFGKDIHTPFALNKAMQTMFVRDGMKPFCEMRVVDDFWGWSQGHMLDVMTWESWQDGDASRLHREGYVGNSVLIGRVSLRQLRVRNQACHLPAERYATLFPRQCRYGYSDGAAFTDRYGANLTYSHAKSDETAANGMQGQHAYYHGGGYQVFLERNRQKAYTQLRDLQEGGWIDKHTRAIMVELALFHPPTGLFTSVRLVAEAPPIGSVFTTNQVVSSYLFKYTSIYDNFVLVCELLLIIVAMVRLHIEVDKLLRLKKDYIKNPWNCIQVGTLVLLLTYIVCYVYRFVIVGDLVEQLRATYHEEYIDISFVACWDQLLRSLLGFIIFCVILLSLRLLRNRPVFAEIGGVYQRAAHEILAFTGIFAVWLCAYTCLGVALYISVIYDFSRWDLGLQAVATLLTGHYALHQVEQYDTTGARLYVVSFLILAVGSLTVYIISVLSFHYKVYRKQGVPSLSTLEAIRVFWTRFLILAGLHRTQQQDSEETILPPEFTMAEIEYQVEEMLFKMNTLAGTCGLPEKPLMYFTDSDCTYGTGEDAISSGGSEVRVFDDEKFESRIHKIEDNLFSHEPHLAQLLQLDAIGADVLSIEKEKILRSQLEMEIFRQLQVQRQDVGHLTLPQPPHRTASFIGNLHSPGVDTNVNNFHGNSQLGSSSHGNTASQSSSQSGSVGVSSSASGSGSHGSSEGSPSGGASQRRLNRISFPKPLQFGGLLPLSPIESSAKPFDCRPKMNRKSPASHASLSKTKSISMSEGLVLQDLSGHNSCANEDIPLQDLHRGSSGNLQNSSGNLQNGSKFTSETQLLEDPASTGSYSSGGHEVQNVLKFDPKKPRPSPNAKTIAEGLPKIVKSRSKSEKAISYECLQDSSSGTELEPTKSSKAKSLRKTKSRGKGKGRNHLTPVEGLDELGIDNRGYYTSESDSENTKADNNTKEK